MVDGNLRPDLPVDKVLLQPPKDDPTKHPLPIVIESDGQSPEMQSEKVSRFTRILEWFLMDTTYLTVRELKGILSAYVTWNLTHRRGHSEKEYIGMFVCMLCGEFYHKFVKSGDWAEEVELRESYRHFKEITSFALCGMAYEECEAIWWRSSMGFETLGIFW